MHRPILCLDFDGVCHAYTSMWVGADIVRDGPVPGLFEFLHQVFNDFEIHIYSSRSNQKGGIEAMQRWFREHYHQWLDQGHIGEWGFIDSLHFPQEKPRAFLTLDDRALTFTGVWPEVETLKQFKPWNKS